MPGRQWPSHPGRVASRACLYPQSKARVALLLLLLRPRHAPEQPQPEQLEEKIRRPEDRLGIEVGTAFERVREYRHKIEAKRQPQAQGDANRRFAPTRLDAERDTDQRERQARDRPC